MIEDNSFLSVNIVFINCLYKSVLLLNATLLTTIWGIADKRHASICKLGKSKLL